MAAKVVGKPVRGAVGDEQRLPLVEPGGRAGTVAHEGDAAGALRVTLGHTSTQADVDAFVDALPAAVQRARRAREAS